MGVHTNTKFKNKLLKIGKTGKQCNIVWLKKKQKFILFFLSLCLFPYFIFLLLFQLAKNQSRTIDYIPYCLNVLCSFIHDLVAEVL